MNQDQVMSLIRQVLSLVGGYLLIKGMVTEIDWSTLVGSATATISIVWSMIAHKK